MDRLAYFREPVDCPECGLPTSYLQRITKDEEQPVLKCQNCIEEEEEEEEEEII